MDSALLISQSYFHDDVYPILHSSEIIILKQQAQALS